MIEFLLKIWRLQAGKDSRPYFFLATKSKASDRWKDHPFRWPIDEVTLEDFLEEYSTDKYNLYFCPLGFSEPQRKKEFALKTVFLWADLDPVKPEQCTPVPQVAWESSPDRYAALWRLNRAYEAKDVEEVNRALSYANGADHGGWDITQVLRIPGSRNHKYKGSPRGKLLWYKTNQLTLDDFPEPVVKLNPVETLRKWKGRLNTKTYRLLTAERAEKGSRSDVIWRLENDLHEQGLSRDEIFTLIKASVWNKFAGRRDEDEQLRRELDKVHGKQDRPTIAGGVKGGITEARGLVRMSDVEAENVDWLWYPYIPLGKVTIIEGDPGLGKSWITLALASFLSNGKPFPGQDRAERGDVLMLSAEDGLADTIRPRLDTLAADVSRVWAVPDPITLDDDGVETIERYIVQVRPKVVVIDPIVAYMGAGVDMHKANETREVMARIARLAETHKVSIILIRHLTKGSRDKSIYRGLGSIDITAAARSVIIVGRNPENPDEGRVLVHVKCNLAPLGKAQAYSLLPKARHPFKFEGPVEFTADEVFKAEATGQDGLWTQAVKFVQDTLKEGAKWADEVRRDAEAKGIATKIINKAKKELNVKVVVMGDRVQWSL